MNAQETTEQFHADHPERRDHLHDVDRACILATIQARAGWIDKLFTPRRVSISLDDLPLFGECGKAVRAHVLECWWLSPVSVELRGSKILAFGLWLSRETGDSHPAGQSHQGACGCGYKTGCTNDSPDKSVLSDIVGSKAPNVGVTSPLPQSDHTEPGCNDSAAGPVATDRRQQCSCRDACHGVPPMQVFADPGNRHGRMSAPGISGVQPLLGRLADDIHYLIAFIFLCAVLAYIVMGFA